MKFSSPLVLLFLFPLVTTTDCGRVLVFPGEYSHWLNMRAILEELVTRNHSVTVLVPAASPSVDYNDSRHSTKFKFLVFKVAAGSMMSPGFTAVSDWLFLFKVPFSRAELHGLTEDFIHFSMYEAHVASPLTHFLKVQEWMSRSFHFGRQQCDAMLKNGQLMATLRDAAFDAVLLDPVVMCGDLVADVLGLPVIISLRFSFGGVMERQCGQAPMPPSYVPVAPLSYGDRMTFRERLISAVTYVVASVMSEVFWHLTLAQYYSEVKGQGVGGTERLLRSY